MSSGKKKKTKSSKKPSSGPSMLTMVIGAVAGLLVVGALIWGLMSVLGQRKSVVGYDATMAKITEVLKTRDPDSTDGALQLSEIEAMVTGTPTVTRETKDGTDYAVYSWSSTVGFRLKLEKNGPTDEVAELVSFGAK